MEYALIILVFSGAWGGGAELDKYTIPSLPSKEICIEMKDKFNKELRDLSFAYCIPQIEY